MLVVNLSTDLSDTAYEAKIQSSSNRLASSVSSDGDASYRQGSRDPSQDGLSLVGPSCPSAPSKPSTDRSLLLHRNELCTFIAKKSQCLLWLAVGSSLARSRLCLWKKDDQTGKVLWQQIKHLPTMGYGTDMLKAYENFIPRQALAGKTFTTQIESLNCRLRHYLARLHRKTLCYSKSKRMFEVS